MDEGERRETLRRIAEAEQRKARLLGGERISEMRALSEEELAEKYDALVDRAAITGPSALDEKMRYLGRAQVYADELARREYARQGERMEALTRETVRQGGRTEALTQSMNRLTWVGVSVAIVAGIATVVGVVVAVMTYLSGG